MFFIIKDLKKVVYPALLFSPFFQNRERKCKGVGTEPVWSAGRKFIIKNGVEMGGAGGVAVGYTKEIKRGFVIFLKINTLSVMIF